SLRRPRGQRHTRQGRILSTRGGHARTVGDKHIAAVVHLVPRVQQRSPRITPHAHTTHFVNVGTRWRVCVVGANIYKPCLLEHFTRLFHIVLNHLVIVLCPFA